jgi:NADH:ubiquinone reductase (H+-translocating)
MPNRYEREQADLPRVVIVGGGFGGVRAAHALRHAPVRVTVLDRNNHHVFQPLLYQVATADLSPADISAPIRGMLRDQRNAETLMAEVTGVDVNARQVIARDEFEGREFTVPYDYLILATGAGPSYFGHDEWAGDAPGLKSLTDATAIRRRILLAFEAAELEQDADVRRAWMTFVIVGGGPTGVELAAAIAELSRRALIDDFRHIDPSLARILLVEAAPRLLNAFPESLARDAERDLKRLGVEIRTGQAVQEVDGESVVIAGERIAAKTVLWAAGVTASPAGRWVGAETDRAGRVLVQRDLSVPGHPEIMVLGDTAHLEQDGKPLPGVAPVAMQQGTYAGKRVLRLLRAQQAKPFRYVDKGNLAIIGRRSAIADFGWLRLHGFVAFVVWAVVHIFYLINFRNRLLVMTQWVWAYLTAQRGARLITQPEPTSVGQPDSARAPIR